ncbi:MULTISPECIES: ATP-dependent nuclease [unclassified Nocardia]|uniref:ATP-dependent nuclease n=1 Tax=unclassified Nocardia TaxID=2637762 RepID=UPI0033A737EF
MGNIIEGIHIENFRSFRKTWIDTPGDALPILGLNSAGKSNILRALDLFFNDSIDGQPIDFTRDLSAHLPRKTKKKIGVGVHLNYPPTFGLKGIQDFFRTHGLAHKIAVYKEWTLDPSNTPQCAVSFGPSIDGLNAPKSASDHAAVTSLIRSIKYHYVTNHVRPADKITEILEALKPEIMKSWKNTYRQSDDFLEHLTAAANQMFEPVSRFVSEGIQGLQISAAVPQDIGELAFELGMNAIANTDIAHELAQEGSGAQAFALLHFLDLQDSAARKRNFGWAQASIWGLEEPESFLHAGLRTRFASDLRRYSESERRQSLLTTHDDDFVRAAPNALIVSASTGGSHVAMSSSRSALETTAKLRITSFRHPLVTFADEPLLLVEGRTDKIYLTAAIKKANMRPRWRIVSPDDDLENGTSGDALLSYLKSNTAALSARPDEAFILVLRDWEDRKAEDKYSKALSCHQFSRAITCPEELCNPKLGQRFVGIERYLPDELIRDTTTKLEIGIEDGVLGIDRTQLERIKPELASRVELGADIGHHMIDIIEWLDLEFEKTLSAVPVDRFL